MKTKIFFLVMILSVLSTMSLSAQTKHIYLDSIPNNTRLYYCDVDSVVVCKPSSSGQFILSVGSVLFTENITITKQTQGPLFWSDIMDYKKLSIYFVSPEEFKKLK